MSNETLSILSTIAHNLWVERWDIFVIAVSVGYRKEILNALKGGNGHLQVDELGKGLILLVFYYSVQAEAMRRDMTHSVFSDAYWFALLGSVALLSGIKGFSEMWTKRTKDETPS